MDTFYPDEEHADWMRKAKPKDQNPDDFAKALGWDSWQDAWLDTKPIDKPDVIR